MTNDDAFPQDPLLLTVLIPTYDEAAILSDTVLALTRFLSSEPWRSGFQGGWEVLIVDDGSTDNSRDILTQLASADSRVRFVSYRTNKGQGGALREGFAAARGKWIFCVDADLDYGPDHIAEFLVAAHDREAKIVVGSAYMPGGSVAGVPRVRYWMSRAMNLYFHYVLGLPFYTYTSIARLYDRRFMQGLLLSATDKDLLPEILIKAALLGVPVVEVPARLRWQSGAEAPQRRGASAFGTARKAVRHLLWGALENPLLFFVLPAVIVAMSMIWFSVAIVVLFASTLARMHGLSLDAISVSANEVVVGNPQTISLFILSTVTALLLFSLGMIIQQNKVKRDHDFIYMHRILSSIQERLGVRTD